MARRLHIKITARPRYPPGTRFLLARVCGVCYLQSRKDGEAMSSLMACKKCGETKLFVEVDTGVASKKPWLWIRCPNCGWYLVGQILSNGKFSALNGRSFVCVKET